MAKTDAKIERLRRVRLFERCAPRELRRVAAVADELTVWTGQILCAEGRPGRECFVILEGYARVEVDGEPVAIVGSGEVVGEMGVLDHAPRTATVTARTQMRVYVIHARHFGPLLEDIPRVGRRVRETFEERRVAHRDHRNRPHARV